MMHEKNDGINKAMVPPSLQQNRPALSWEMKIPRKWRIELPNLGMFRPIVGQCCQQCNPDSLSKNLGQKPIFGFRNFLFFNETHTRYRGWLVRRVCCLLFVSGCKVYTSPVCNRLERVCQSNRVKEALTAENKAPEGGDGQEQTGVLSPFLPLINTCISPGLLRFVGWLMLKMFPSRLDRIQLNLARLPALQRASQEGSPLVYVYMRQSIMDCALLSLVLFCGSLRVPYTFCPHRIDSCFLRSILQKVGVVLLQSSALTEKEAGADCVYSAVMTSLLCELLREGQAISVGLSVENGRGNQWLAYIRQLINEGSVPDVTVVPVGISYDCVPKTNVQVGLRSVLWWLWSVLWRTPEGGVRIDLAQPFSLKEMSESWRCTVDEWLPLQDLLLPVILNNRTECGFGRRRMLWLLPSELKEQAHPERDLSITIILHLIFSATSCMAVMSTGLMASLLLYKHSKGANISQLCRDMDWLTEELVFRGKDVGFRGSLPEVVHYALSLLTPHVIIAALPSRKDPFIVPRPSLSATLHLTIQAQIVTQTFILEAVGACTVMAMLCEVARSGVSSKVSSSGLDGDEVKDDSSKFAVSLCQSELTERALQLCHLLPPGVMPPCQSSRSFALDAVDSLVRCGILIMEEIPRDVPICDFWKREGTMTWTTTDDPYHSDSDCEEQELRSYKISQTSQCPEMFFFLCRMLAGHLRTLCWTVSGLDLFHKPLPEAEFVAQVHAYLFDRAKTKKQNYESCSEEAAHAAVRTLTDLGVLLEERQEEGVFLGITPLFQLSENRQKLHGFISQYVFN